MASCDTQVLNGMDGLIQFKPLGTTNCIDDYCPFMGDRIYLPCSADYDIGDCLEVERVKIPSAEGVSADGGINVIQDGDQFYVVDDGKGVAGDVDACGNDMEGVPYIKVSLIEDGAAIIWNTDKAGEELTTGTLTGSLSVATAGAGYTPGTYPNIELTNALGSGRGAAGTVTVSAAGEIASVVISSGGTGYASGDLLNVNLSNGNGTDAQLQVLGSNVTDVRGNSSEGHYIFRLCEFQTVCGVRSFSIDLSRDELDVTTLPCSVGESCEKRLVSFRKTQAGFATATGTLEVYFTCDNESIQNRLLQGSLQHTQGSASVRLYVCTRTDASGEIDLDRSLYIEADIQLLGMSFSVNPDDPTTATINFGVTSVASAFGLS